MNTKSLLLSGLLAFTASSALQAQEVKFNVPVATDQSAATAEETPEALAYKVTETEIMETFGWFLISNLRIEELKFNNAQIEAFSRGVVLATRGQDTPHDLKTVIPAMDTFINERQVAAIERLRQGNLVAGTQFFSALKSRPGIITTESGLYYEILQTGEGPMPTAADRVKINYKGMLLNGLIFDDTERHGGSLAVPLDSTLPGWVEGVQKINKGGKIKLYLPNDLAYGERQVSGVPPGSSLIFEIELLEINPVVEAAAAVTAE